MTHRQEDLDRLAQEARAIQEASDKFITVRQAAVKWKMSPAGAYKLLRVMMDRGMVRKVGTRHYHIVEVKK